MVIVKYPPHLTEISPVHGWPYEQARHDVDVLDGVITVTLPKVVGVGWSIARGSAQMWAISPQTASACSQVTVGWAGERVRGGAERRRVVA
jgi:hypothetical protein